MQTLTFKYRLYPSPAQRKALQGTLDACRWVYNKTLEIRKNAWKQEQKSLSLYATRKELTKWKKENPWLSQAFSQCLQEAQERVDLAFKKFFRRKKAEEKVGYPRFKGEWYKSFTYPQFGFKLIDNKYLYLSKIGNVKIILHRPLNDEIKRLVIKKDKLNNWWACFICKANTKEMPAKNNVVGIDMGCEYFATLSTGEQIENPRFFRRDEKAKARVQRRLSHCQDKYKRIKLKKVIQHIDYRIANRRRDFAHKLSRRLVNEFQIIVFEKLNIPKMQEGNWRSLNKSISDAAWNQVIRMTQYKAENAKRTVILVNPKNTSQICSNCGEKIEKTLDMRIHTCSYCGLTIKRDINAARNILALGLQSIGNQSVKALNDF